MKHKSIVSVVVLLAAVILMLGLWFVNRPTPSAGEKALTITVVHADQSEKKFDVKTDADTLEEVLLENHIVEDNQGDMGLYILTADGETVDESKKEWWCITKEGKVLSTGATDTMIADGEAYELTFTVGY